MTLQLLDITSTIAFFVWACSMCSQYALQGKAWSSALYGFLVAVAFVGVVSLFITD